jgi:hypothetical protein
MRKIEGFLPSKRYIGPHAKCYLLSKGCRFVENPSMGVEISTSVLGFSASRYLFESR